MDTAKDMCISIMKDLDIYKPYINGFKNKDDVCFFEGFGGYWVYQEEDIYDSKTKSKDDTIILG